MYKSRLQNEFSDQLFEAILALKTQEECYRFFEDLTTVSELHALSQRIVVASMLEEDETYADIAKITGASTATISRVKRCLNYGSDGYKLVLKRLKNQDSAVK